MAISNPLMPSVADGLHVDDLTLGGTGLLITARTTAAQVPCGVCGSASTRVHSTYWRTFEDLPWQDRAVTWRVQLRLFRCCHCPGRIFAESVPGMGARKARRSDWLAEAQTDIGMVLGGEPGARLSRRLAMPVNGAELGRQLRASGFTGSLRVVGKWATRRRRSERAPVGAPGKVPSTRILSRLMTSGRDNLTKAEAVIVATIETEVPMLDEARALLSRFQAMIHERKRPDVDAWIEAAKQPPRALRRRPPEGQDGCRWSYAGDWVTTGV